jgi:hypothetical protein
LITQSISKKKYNIAYEVSKRFISDLKKIKDPPIFEQLINHFAEDVSRYEAKIALAFSLKPFMNGVIVGRLMKTI